MKSNYPDTVKEWLNGLYDQVKEKGFLEDEELGELSEERVEYHFQEVIGEAALQSWLKEGEVKMEEKELTLLLFQVVIKSHIDQLKEDGVVNSIEDEEGKEVMWLTNKGKKTIQ